MTRDGPLVAPGLSQETSFLPRLVNESGLLFAVYAWLLLHVMGQKSYDVALLRGLRGGTADAEIASSTNGT